MNRGSSACRFWLERNGRLLLELIRLDIAIVFIQVKSCGEGLAVLVFLSNSKAVSSAIIISGVVLLVVVGFCCRFCLI